MASLEGGAFFVMGARIPESQKLLILADAIGTSAPAAAARWGVSEKTIYVWGDKHGGLLALREVWEAKQLAAVSEMVVQVSHELRQRLPKFSEESITALALQVLEQPAKPSGVTLNVNANASAASAAGSVSAAEAAYIAALRGQPSTEGGESAELPPVQVSGNGAGGPEPAADHQ